MTSLDERIASLFRKAPPADADPTPLLAYPVAEEPMSEAVASDPAGEEISETRVDEKPALPSGDNGGPNDLAIGKVRFGYGDPPPLGTTRHQSEADEINARQSG